MKLQWIEEMEKADGRGRQCRVMAGSGGGGGVEGDKSEELAQLLQLQAASCLCVI